MTPENKGMNDEDKKAINQIVGGERVKPLSKPSQPENKEKPNGTIPHSIHIDGYYKGFHVEVIQTDPNEVEATNKLIHNAKNIVDAMEKDGWLPSWNSQTNKDLGAVKQSEQKEIAPICEIHKTPMTWKTGVSKKTGKPYAFWTCSLRNPDGSFCSYKPAQK